MNIDDKKIKNILLSGGYVTNEDFVEAEKYAKKHRASAVDYFLAEGIISRDILGQAAAEFFKLEYADLNSNQPSREQVLKIPEGVAKKFRLVLFKEDKNGAVISTDNPEQKGILSEAVKALKTKKVKLAYSLPEDIDAAFVYYRKTLDTRFNEIIKAQKRIAPEIIEQIINDALTFHASDIHFDPQEEETVIRFRVDGVLQEAGRVSKEHYENILNRIKVQANLRIDEHFTTQDGAIRINDGKMKVDMRVSVAPTVDGEKVVIRLLAQYVRGITLSDLGLGAKQREEVEKASRKPFGMILVTGPTGSGKSTTLYALLKLLNKPEVNITTIEDPVEYKIAEANQIQVNAQRDLTFAKGLRSIVRQDPDIILVGEIRDNETAEIAVNAALTGHLLLSTFHANDAATAIPRLLDMGIEPFLLSSTLEEIIAQRLVRKICDACRYSYSEKISDIEKLIPAAKNYFGNKKEVTLYKGKGCSACGNVGYKGRTAIFEIISITPEIENLILKNPSSQQVWELAEKQGARSFFKDGIDKVENGTTSLEELLRVAEAD